MAHHVTEEYSRGIPSYGVQCAGTVGAHRCCGCGVAPPERPSPLRVCSYLSNNRLTGSVPSSLSALTNLIELCVPLLANGVCTCGRGGSDRSALLRARGMSGGALHVWGIEQGGAAAGLLRYSQRGPRAGDVNTEYSRGSPPIGTVRGYRRGTWLLWVRRSTAERPSPLRVCSFLLDNTLTGSVPSSLSALTKLSALCVPPSCQRCLHLCGRGGSDRSALLRVRAMSGVACRGHRAGAMRQQGRCGALRGDPWHAM